MFLESSLESSIDTPIHFNDEKTALNIYPRQPIVTSLQSNWREFGLAYMCQPPFSTPEMVTSRWHGICIFTHGDRIINAQRKLDGKTRLDEVPGGSIVINPAHISQQATWDDEGDFMILAIETQLFDRIVSEAQTPIPSELLPCFSTPDPLVYQIGLALKNVLITNAIASRLYAETMISALSVHLLQHYASDKPILKEYSDGLSKAKLQQIINYIKSNLDRDLSLTELAELVQMSSPYFCQLFKRSLGMTPHQYVIRCRIERAKELLLQEKISICEIAQIVGFANQSHLNHHFKKMVGTTPKKFVQK